MTDFFVRFVNSLDPNESGATDWPEYTVADTQMLVFQEGATPLTVIKDTFRKEAMDFLMELSLAEPL